MEIVRPASTLDVKELVQLGAVDNDFFAHSFFGEAFRQRSPAFHRDMDELLDNPSYRKVNLRCFRGSAKTTKLRVYAAKRIAYAMSRTILYVGASESHAVRSIQWLRTRIESKLGADGISRPSFFASVYGLRPGRKWTDTEIEVYHGVDERPIWVLGVGITGNIRGINFDDYRPDLIILDDIVTDENGATHEQREKVVDLVLGAVENSLVSEVDEPNAKIVMLQTPIHADDVSARATKVSSWHTANFGCWTKETSNLPVEEQRSSWEELYPTPTLQQKKLDAIEGNALSKFSREMECKLTNPESCSFRPEWLKFYEDAPKGGICVLAIDPVPPPSPQQIAKGLVGKDYEAQVVWRRSGGNYYLVDYVLHRGHEPNWSVVNAMALATKHKVAKIKVESVAYQRSLKWMIEQEMKRRGVYFVIDDNAEHQQKSKFVRISNVFAGPASHGKIFVKKIHSDFISQFEEYGPFGVDYDDLLDASATAVSELISPYMELADDEYFELDRDLPKMKLPRRCP